MFCLVYEVVIDSSGKGKMTSSMFRLVTFMHYIHAATR